LRNLSQLARFFLAFQQRKTTCPYPPIQLRIEPTSLCNLKCPMCPNQSLDPSEKGFMPWELFRKLIDETSRYAYDVYLFHRGESLMHPRFFEMVEYAEGKGLLTRLHTNATLLSKEKAYKLLDSGLDFLSFSFDGFTKEIYERIRVGASFEDTLHNILFFLSLKKKFKRSKPYTVIQVLDIPGVKTDTRNNTQFMHRFHSFPLDEIRVIPAHNWAGAIDLVPPKNGTQRGICTFPWYSLTVLWNGTVVPCPQDFMGELSLGNAWNRSILSIWNNKRMIAFRQTMIDGHFEDLTPCNTCDRVLRNTVFRSYVPKQYLSTFLVEHLLGYKWQTLLRKIYDFQAA
jgi:radical SAM protein with 4Fe4S-binding SPASM domain